jgi:hypothetical protein
MASDRKQPPPNRGSPQRRPEWADGLKQLYDSVVEEELPESFKILLARLDEIDPHRGDLGSSLSRQGPDDQGTQG